jgi:hypothetical protein
MAALSRIVAGNHKHIKIKNFYINF